MIYNNYHSHKWYSNLSTLDVITSPMDYINRAKELGHKNYFTTEHGWMGDVYEAYSLCKKNDLKCISGAEVYYVDDRHQKDNSNYHLIIINLNKDGFKDTNRIISQANTDGYYYKARIDKELLLSLNPKNVVITTACVAGRLFKTDDYINEFLLPVYDHFKDHFYLEVQSHVNDVQGNYNSKILELHNKYNIPIIHANDSHYIYPKDAYYRDMFLKAKGFSYPSENGFILDYPNDKTIIQRYKNQNVLSEKQAEEALNNTLIFDDCEDLGFNYDIKIPKLYKDKDSNTLLKQIVKSEWEKKKSDIPINKQQACIDGIKYELNVINETGMADYFIDDYEITKKAVNKYHAYLTATGRGSSVSYLTNCILGFTQVNRIVNDAIPLYPSRFMSKARILQTRSLPDIDLNMASQDGFIQASKDVLGNDNVYSMISYKPLQESSAFRLWCKAKCIDKSKEEQKEWFNQYNEVAKNLDSYRSDTKWGKLIEESKVFIGVIESVSPSPCSFLLYDKPISQEVGLMRIGSENKAEYVICCNMDKHTADEYKFLKNDYLVAQVLNIVKGTCEYENIPIPNLNQLEKLLDEKTWDIYKNGYTATVNQFDSDFARPLAMKYKPHNVSEVAGLVAAIRPGFSLLDKFLNREKYSTGVPQIDELLSRSNHFILYQENIMQFLIYCGIEEDLTYGIIKSISKKKMTPEDFQKLKDTVKEGYKKKIGSYDGFEDIWSTMQSASNYSFNSAHALSYAYDSIYCAYLKSHYPLSYFTTVLNMYEDNTDETSKITKELPNFNITIKNIKFRHSKDVYFFDKNENCIYKGIASIKNCNKRIGEELYSIKDMKFNTFTDFLVYATEKLTINKTQIDTLIKLDFFSEFGNNKKLSILYQAFKKGKLQYKKTYCEKTKIKRIELLKEYESKLPNDKIPIKLQLAFETETLGNPVSTYQVGKGVGYITSLDTKYSPKLKLYGLSNGVSMDAKIPTKIFNKNKLNKNDIIQILGFEHRPKSIKTENGFEKSKTEREWWITKYNILNLQ